MVRAFAFMDLGDRLRRIVERRVRMFRKMSRKLARSEGAGSGRGGRSANTTYEIFRPEPASVRRLRAGRALGQACGPPFARWGIECVAAARSRKSLVVI